MRLEIGAAGLCGVRLAVAALLVGLIVGACGYDSRGDTTDSIPCEEPAQYVNLGRPKADGEYTRTAEITVDAEGKVWASLSGPIPPGGFIPQTDVAGLYFGRSSLPPTSDPGSSTIGNTLDGNPDDDILTSVHLHYQGFAEIPFPDNDRYWIVLTQGGDLELFTCEPNILSDAVRPTGGWTGEDFVFSQTRAEIITSDSDSTDSGTDISP